MKMETMNIDIKWKKQKFNDLTLDDLYKILQLRSEIFVVAQTDIYLDADGKDQKAIHLLGSIDGKIVAYARLFRTGNYHKEEAAFGRVLIVKEYRERGVGRILIKEAIEGLKDEKSIRISAQLYLQRFYESFGFVIDGQVYLDGSIEHIDMSLKL